MSDWLIFIGNDWVTAICRPLLWSATRSGQSSSVYLYFTLLIEIQSINQMLVSVDRHKHSDILSFFPHFALLIANFRWMSVLWIRIQRKSFHFFFADKTYFFNLLSVLFCRFSSHLYSWVELWFGFVNNSYVKLLFSSNIFLVFCNFVLLLRIFFN